MQCIQATSLSKPYAAKGLCDNQLHTNGTQASFRLQMSKAKLWHIRHATAQHGYAMTAHRYEETNAETGKPSGIPQRHNAHSSPYWFTKFCYSACLSHFAAPFIIIPAKTSNAENCGEQGKHTRRQEMTQRINKANWCPDKPARQQQQQQPMQQ